MNNLFRCVALCLSLCIATFSVYGNLMDELILKSTEETLPIVNLEVEQSKINKLNYIPANITIYDKQCRTEGNSVTQYRCKVKYRGASSLKYEKKSLAVKMLDDYDEDLDVNVFGIREDNNWILDAMAIDRIRMRNRICFDCWNAISKTPYETDYNQRNGTLGEFVELFINGEYHGLYCMTDKINRKLLGLKKAKVADSGDVTVRGVLYKCNNWGGGCSLKSYEEDDMNSEEWNAWELQYPDDYPSEQAWTPLVNLIDFCGKSSLSIFRTQYNDWFYLDNLVDYAVLTYALGIRDTGYKNTFLSSVNIQEANRYLLTVWDMDTSLGGEYNGDYYDKYVDVNWITGIQPFGFLYLCDIDNFKEKLKESWIEKTMSVLSPSSIKERIRNYADRFITTGAWDREYSRWNNNPIPLNANLNDEIDYVNMWLDGNVAYINTQFGIDDLTSINESEMLTPKIIIVGNRLLVSDLYPDVLVGVYDMSGKILYYGYEKEIELSNKGMYILKINDKVYKIII